MLTITLLGEQAVVDAATGEVRTRASRTIALLAYLVAHQGSPQPRVRIAGRFWPESGDAQALTNLRRELHQLRGVLEGAGSALEVTATDLTWHPDRECRVDLADFLRERAAAREATSDTEELAHGLAALRSYGGDLLPGMDVEWLVELRAQLSDQCVATCDLVTDAAHRCGRPSDGVEAARKRIEVAPLEERGYRTLMRLQAELGDRADAITTYHRCASILERELGVEPDPATERELRALLGGPSPASTEAGRSSRTRPPVPGLLGRDAESALLRSAWQRAAAGRCEVVLVHGDPGVGKSRLVDQLASEVAATGAAVATSRCFEATGRLSLAPVAEWVRSPAISAARTTLDPVWQSEVDRLAPGEGTGPLARDRVEVDVWERHRFFEGVARCLLAVSRPTLLVLDNLQWCDEDSLTFCAMMLNLARRAPVLLVVISRVDDFHGGSAAGRWLDRVRADELLSEVPLEPLDPAGAAAVAEAITGRTLDPASVAGLHAATGGFPLYVVEASRSTVDLETAIAEPTGAFGEILHKRVDRLSPDARSVAALAAAAGQDVELALLTEASDLDPDRVVTAVDELWTGRLLREEQGRYGFTHDLLREAAYRLESPPRRWLLHRRLAQSLELLHAGRTDEVAAQVAEQYAAAGNSGRATTYYRRAAVAAAAVFAHAEALRYHRTTLDLVLQRPPSRDRDELELECLMAMVPPLNALYGYSAPQLHDTCARSVALAERLGRTGEQLTTMVGLWACRFVQGRIGDSYALAHQVSALGGARGAHVDQTHLSLGGAALHLGRTSESLGHFEVALESASTEPLSVGTRARVHIAAWAAHAVWTAGADRDPSEMAHAAVEDARGLRHEYSLAVALAYAGITHQLSGDRALVTETADELTRLCERCGFAYYVEWANVLGGWAAGGDAGAARGEAGIRALRQQGALARMPYWLMLVADTRTDPEQERRALDAALAAAARQGEAWMLPEVQRRRALHEPGAEARRQLQSAAALADEQGSVQLAERCRDTLRGLVSAGER